MDIIVIHPTTLNRLDCRLQYHWSRNYKSRSPQEKYSFGVAIHEALAAWYGSACCMDPVKVFLENCNKLKLPGSSRILGTEMLNNYVRVYHPFDSVNFQTVAVEKEIAVRIPKPDDETGPGSKFYIGARIDGIIKDLRDGMYYVLEHKTFDKFYSSTLSTDMQFVFEKYIAERWLKKPIAGVIYNGLRKATKRTAQTNLFERHTILIPQAQIRIALYRAYWTLSEIHSGSFKIYPSPGFKCNGCEFLGPCTEYMHGGDYQFYLDNAFDKREEDNEEWIS